MVDFLVNFGQSPMSLAMSTSAWVVPTMQSIHIMSIATIFISVLVIAMRVLGLAWQGQSIHQTVGRFAPWAWGSLVVLACTGVVLILAEPLREIMAISFWVKMGLLVVAIIISVRFLNAVRRDQSFAEPIAVAGRPMKIKTVLTLVVWVAIIFMGRFIAYDPLIWGALSPIGSV
jgi:hypothetical protein